MQIEIDQGVGASETLADLAVAQLHSQRTIKPMQPAVKCPRLFNCKG